LPGPSGCDNACGSTAEFDECNVCGGDGIAEGDCDCAGNVEDLCGECGGPGPVNGLCNGTPSEFLFNQSLQQAFYFFIDVTVEGVAIESSDWVGAFNGDVCVGARQWDTSGVCSDGTSTSEVICHNNGQTWTWSQCGNGICDVPTMGDSGPCLAVIMANYFACRCAI
jgi:hypothetical protein